MKLKGIKQRVNFLLWYIHVRYTWAKNDMFSVPPLDKYDENLYKCHLELRKRIKKEPLNSYLAYLSCTRPPEEVNFPKRIQGKFPDV